jgi:hypothetical protein
MYRLRRLERVSALVTVLKIKLELYTTLLRFFWSTAFTVETWYLTLTHLVKAQVPMMEIEGRLVVPGGHIKI